MDAVFADPATGHDDVITDERLFFVTRHVIERARHDGTGAAVDQRLAGKTVVKLKRTVNRRDPRFVATVLNPFNHPFKNPAWMQ